MGCLAAHSPTPLWDGSRSGVFLSGARVSEVARHRGAAHHAPARFAPVRTRFACRSRTLSGVRKARRASIRLGTASRYDTARSSMTAPGSADDGGAFGLQFFSRCSFWFARAKKKGQQGTSLLPPKGAYRRPTCQGQAAAGGAPFGRSLDTASRRSLSDTKAPPAIPK